MLSALVFILLPSFKNNNEINKCFKEDHTSNKHEAQEPYPFLSTCKALLPKPLETAPGPAALTGDPTHRHTQRAPELVLLKGLDMSCRLGFPATI